MREISMIRAFSLPEKKIRNLKFPLALTGENIFRRARMVSEHDLTSFFTIHSPLPLMKCR